MIQNLKTLKENKDIKYIYKIPCSYLKEGFLYVIIGTLAEPIKDEFILYMSLEKWFERMQQGDLLMYACATLPKKYKLKEHLNIYSKPDLLKFRKFILTNKVSDLELCLETAWAGQILTEWKINRYDVVKTEPNVAVSLSKFLASIDPMYKKHINDGD